MTRPEVLQLLQEMQIPAESSMHGFELRGNWRLTHGGGIAGRSGVWWLERRNGRDKTGQAQNKTELRRILETWEAMEM